MRLISALPDFLLIALFRFVFNMKNMDIGGARHARNAREEMVQLSQEFLSLDDSVDVNIPTLRELHEYAVGDALIENKKLG